MAEDTPAWDINPQLPQLRKNIQNKIESGGDYGAVGPYTGKMGRGLGVGQVMSANLPEWSRAILGREISEKEFLGNKRLQDRIINNKLGEYLNSTGNPADAASMWFTGKPLRQGANRADVFGTTGAQYAKTATQGLPPAEKARPKWDTSTGSTEDSGGFGDLSKLTKPEDPDARALALGLLEGGDVSGALTDAQIKSLPWSDKAKRSGNQSVVTPNADAILDKARFGKTKIDIGRI